MTKFNLSWKKLSGLALGITFSALPFAVAASCGESNPPEEETVNTPVAAELAKIEADLANSSTNNIQWLNLPQLIEPAASYSYLLSEDETVSDLISNESLHVWSPSLPAEISDFMKRPNLWVKVIPKSGVTLPSREQYINVTKTSKVQSIKIYVNVVAPLEDFVANEVELIGQSDRPGIDVFNFPVGTKLQFSLKNAPYRDKDDFLNYLKSPEVTSMLTPQDYSQISVRLVASDSARYLLAREISGKVKPSVIFADASLSAALKTALQNIQVINAANKTQLDVEWSGWQEAKALFPDAKIASFSYYIGPAYLKDQVKALPESAWKTGGDLPTSLSTRNFSRNFWVRFTPQSGTSLAESYFNLTFSSQIRNVKTLITTDQVNMDRIQPNILEYSASRKRFEFRLNQYISVEHNYGSQGDALVLYRRTPKSEWKNGQEINDELDKLPGPPPANYFANTRVKLAPDYSLTVLSADREQAMNVIGFNKTSSLISFIKNELAKITVNVKSSTPSALVWNDYSLAPEPLVKEMSASLLPAENLTSATLVNPVSDFRLKLPVSAEEDPQKRFFYAYIIPDGLQVMPLIIDLTESSQIRQVISAASTK